jgi:hypothetical protein
MFNTYREVFSELAQEHEAWIVAGSILLPRVKYYTQVSEESSAAATDDSDWKRGFPPRGSTTSRFHSLPMGACATSPTSAISTPAVLLHP